METSTRGHPAWNWLRSLVLHAQRMFKASDSGVATADERRTLAAAHIEGFAVDALAWRRSALVIAATALAVSAVLLSGEAALRWNHHAHGRTLLGVVLDVLLLRVAIPWVVLAITLVALRRWTRPVLSRRLMFWAAGIEILPAFGIAMLPPSWLFHLAQGPTGRFGSGALRLALAIGLMLRLSGILSAAFRSSIATKCLLPESSVPGGMILALVPIKLGIAVVVYVVANALVQGVALLGAWTAFVLWQGSYLASARGLLRATDERGIARTLSLPNTARMVLVPVAGLCLVLFLLTSANSFGAPILHWHQIAAHWPILLAVVTNYAVTLVAGTDLLLLGLSGLVHRRVSGADGAAARLSDKCRSLVAADLARSSA